MVINVASLRKRNHSAHSQALG